MDSDRFDSLARSFAATGSRRRALAALVGSLALTLAGVSVQQAEAKKKKKKACPPCRKRKQGTCKKKETDGTACPGGSCLRGRCVATSSSPVPPAGCPTGTRRCDGTCISTSQCCTRTDCPALATYRCCQGLCTEAKRDPGAACNFFQDAQCCSDYCQAVSSFRAECAATCQGRVCTPAGGCCRGFTCRQNGDGSVRSYCGGCVDSPFVCVSDADCCFSDCTADPSAPGKNCMSYAGGPCSKNYDCRSCAAEQECTVTVDGATRDICTNGVCGCPDECCSNDDCDVTDECVLDPHGMNGTCEPIGNEEL